MELLTDTLSKRPSVICNQTAVILLADLLHPLTLARGRFSDTFAPAKFDSVRIIQAIFKCLPMCNTHI